MGSRSTAQKCCAVLPCLYIAVLSHMPQTRCISRIPRQGTAWQSKNWARLQAKETSAPEDACPATLCVEVSNDSFCDAADAGELPPQFLPKVWSWWYLHREWYWHESSRFLSPTLR